MANERSSPMPEENLDDAITEALGKGTIPDKFNFDATPQEAAGAQTVVDRDRLLGEFRILRTLGKGGMAEVYLAEQTSLHRNVAVKVLRPELTADSTYLRRFQTEAKAAAKLNHPNIVQVYTVGEDHGIQFIAQEYVQGTNLKEFLAKKGSPDAETGMALLRQVASALEAAHAAGIVHRDIKPENIMITRRGEVKVADFGLAKQADAAVHLTQKGTTMGTPLYMSPEQINGEDLDHRSDIYSLGVTFYHLFAGQPPFRAETAVRVAMQHLQDEAPELEQLRPDLPVPLCRMIHRMIMKDRAKRYQQASSIVRDLDRLMAAMAAPAENGAPAAVTEQAAPVRTPARKKRERTAESGAYRARLNFLDRLLAPAGWPWHRQAVVFLGLGLFVGGVAAGVGWAMRVPDPLAQGAPEAPPEVPRQDSARQQFELARQNPSLEAGWRAVLENYPNDLFYRPRAEFEIAWICLAEGRNDEAEALFKSLASYSEIDSNARAAGLAGQAIILSLKNEHARSQELMLQVIPLARERMLDPRLRTPLTKAAERNREALKSQTSPDWDKIFEEADTRRNGG